MADIEGGVEVAELRDRWVGFEFDRKEFSVDLDDVLKWSESVGETDPRFTDPEHPGFRAHPTYATHFSSGRMLPDDFPRIGSGNGIDGGKAIDVLGPIRPGDRLTASTELAEIYEKTGRSGTMVFIVQRMHLTNQDGEDVATVDWRMIRQA